MAIYSKLLLSTGGGIISSLQQAEQVTNTASILIGLGGTGVDCIRTIKTQVYTRLKPDDVNAVVPEYKRIRFIGVDTDTKTQGRAEEQNTLNLAGTVMPLDDTEFFSIANSNLRSAFENRLALEKNIAFSWLENERIDVPDLTQAGAGGNRQVGRFMMMDKSQSFMAKVRQEINIAKAGLTTPNVNIHIFSGLSGGTGAGCFLDVCYMIQSITKDMGGATVFGYFFLPDVNLSRISEQTVDVRKYIPQNGYASMQELDYCMNIPKNGGSFIQPYQDNTNIRWETPPVDMCHLICATDQDSNVIPNAYDYAMNVTAEYLMDFLTESKSKFNLTQQLSNFRSMIGQSNNKKSIGSEMAYCIIGAACASIPIREINTYLASELFNKFSTINDKMPQKEDTERLAISTLAMNAKSLEEIYDSLYYEIREGVYQDFAPFPEDWKFVRDYGNNEFLLHYTNQTASKISQISLNAKSMSDLKNEKSLIGRLQAELKKILADYERGPIYAYRMLEAAQSNNFLNIIDKLLSENTQRLTEEAAQSQIRKGDYEVTKSDFENRRSRKMFDTDKARFNEYEYFLMMHEQHKITLEVYKSLESVLTTFKNQVRELTASYYIKLAKVTDTLIQTFKENKNALAAADNNVETSSFDIPMMSISELKNSLDAEIEKIDISNMLEDFMLYLVDNKDAWISEDENRISRLVTRFFVDKAFHDFANKTITSFLRDKYENKTNMSVTDEELTNHIYKDWMKVLTAKARPLFYFNRSIWQESQTSKLAFLSYPDTSDPIKNAAEKMNQVDDIWGLKNSALTDRIFVMCSACGLPLSSYNNCGKYEKDFFSAKTIGRHIYEGKNHPYLQFNDWNKLPSVTPQSIIDTELIPHDMKVLVEDARALYKEARAFGALDDSGNLCEPNEEDLENIENLCKQCESLIQSAKTPQDISALQKAVEELQEKSQIAWKKTGFAFPEDGVRRDMDSILSIQQDHFVSAPATHKRVKEIIDKVKQVQSRSQKVQAEANGKIQIISKTQNMVAEYCDAVFCGIFSFDGRVMTYRQNNHGLVNEIILSQRGENFPFADIPVYQGFLTFQTLEDKEKAAIKQSVNEQFNTNEEELIRIGNELKERMSNDRIGAWHVLSKDYKEYDEITKFLTDFVQRFRTFCIQNGIK